MSDAAAAKSTETPKKCTQSVSFNHCTIVQKILSHDKRKCDTVIEGRAMVQQVGVRVFVNAMNFKMDFFDNDLHVSTGHTSLMLLHHSKYDSYRQMTDLHFNTVYTGEGATSKSYLFEKMKQMSIPATVSELTYQTAK